MCATCSSSVGLKELEDVCYEREYAGVQEGVFGSVDEGLGLDVEGGGREVSVAVGGHFGEVTECLCLGQRVWAEVEVCEEEEEEEENVGNKVDKGRER